MTILFLKITISDPDIRTHKKWAAVSLVIAYGHFNFYQGLCGLTYSLYHPQGDILFVCTVFNANNIMYIMYKSYPYRLSMKDIIRMKALFGNLYHL